MPSLDGQTHADIDENKVKKGIKNVGADPSLHLSPESLQLARLDFS